MKVYVLFTYGCGDIEEVVGVVSSKDVAKKSGFDYYEFELDEIYITHDEYMKQKSK